ncbi:MAG: hypothetical protein AB2689_04270 [Candidatus Thiodiazotropha taylori]
MSPLRAFAFMLSVLFFVSGCANLQTVSRNTDLPGNDVESTGKAIHLDAKQRLAFAKAFGIVCAEPSPDALAASGSGFGVGASAKDAGTANLSSALSEAAGSIGLRTQSIQMMRDALYRVCEMYYGKALNSVQVWELHQRFQDIMVGILAIEQLTGAVKAQQVLLNTGGTASAASTLSDLESLLANARENETKRAAELEEAELAVTDAQNALNKAITDLSNAASATPPATQAVITQLTATRDEKQASFDSAVSQLEMRRELSDQAIATRKALEQSHGDALVNTSAGATSAAQFSANVSTNRLNDASTKEIAAAVTTIVQEIVRKPRIADKCMDLLTDAVGRKHVYSLTKSKTSSNIYDLCLRMIAGEKVVGN